MAQTKRLIFRVTGLKKSFGSNSVLKVNKLEIHPGTIYGIIGTVGCGKSTLLNILSGVDQQSSGVVLYDDQPYERNWLGRIVVHEEVFYSRYPEIHGSGQTVSSYIAGKFGKKKNVIENRYFSAGSFKNLWSRKIKGISRGELHWLGMILACEVDPRVLLIDDYGMYFNGGMEKDFRNQITKMNRTLGTTIVLSAPSDINLKHFASVLIYMDHGHISKIRPGKSRKTDRNNMSERRHKHNYRNKKKRQNKNRR